MKRQLFLLSLLLGASGAHSGSKSQEIDPAPETSIIAITVENTSSLSDIALLQELSADLLQNQYANINGKLVNLCVDSVCDTIDLSGSGLSIQVETIGLKETIQPSQFARDVGSMVGSAVGGVHGSAQVKVKVTETTKKGADGSSETSKSVDVSVSISAGKK